MAHGAPPGAQIAVVGGGVAGLSVAYHLAALGCTDVTLYEAEDMLAAGTTAKAVGGFRRQAGDPLITELARRSLAVFDEFEARFGQAIDLRRNGYLFLATSEGQWEAMRRRAAAERALGVPVETWTPDEVRRLLPGVRTDDVVGGTFCGDDGLLDPAGVAAGYAAAARRLGVRIRTRRRVEPIGALPAAVKVIAVGPDVRRESGLGSALRVCKRHVFALTPTPALPHGSPLVLTEDPPFYAVAETASVLVSPAEAEEARLDCAVEDEARALAMERAAWRIPALGGCAVRRGWAGLRTLTPDGRPVVGWLPGRPGVFVHGAFNGKGVMLAPALGELAARLILGLPVDPAEAAALSPGRLPPPAGGG